MERSVFSRISLPPLSLSPLFSLFPPFSLFSLISLLCLLTACDFSPVYGTHHVDADDSPVAVELNQVAIDNIPDRNGQILRNALIDRMYGQGRPGQPSYHLSIKTHFNEQDIGVLSNATSTRTLLDTYADYKLNNQAGATVLSGTAHSTTSFNKLTDQYGTLVARDDAYQRTLHEISEQIVNRVSLYFSEREEGNVPLPPQPDRKPVEQPVIIPNALPAY